MQEQLPLRANKKQCAKNVKAVSKKSYSKNSNSKSKPCLKNRSKKRWTMWSIQLWWEP